MKKWFVLTGLVFVLLLASVLVAGCGGASPEPPTSTGADTTEAGSNTGDVNENVSTPTVSELGETGAGAAKDDTLRVGVITSATGDMSVNFRTLYDAIGPTQDLLNEMGGVTVGSTHYDIELVGYDDQSTSAGATTAANMAIEEGIKFIHPPHFMPANLAIAPLCEDNQIIRIKGLGASAQELNADNPYMLYSDSVITNLPPFYEWLVENYPNAKRIAVLTADDPGMATHQQMCKACCDKYGLEIVYWEVYPQPTFDFYSVLNKVLPKRPDVIDMISGIPNVAAALINQSRELGFTGLVVAGACVGDANVLNDMVTPKYAYNIIQYSPDVNSDKMTDSVKKLGQKIKASGSPWQLDATFVLDAVLALKSVVETAQTLDTHEIVAAIDNGVAKDFEGIWGPAVWGSLPSLYGSKHCGEHAPMLSIVKDGQVQFEWLPWDGAASDFDL